MTGIERIAAERKRQTEREGWTAEHDQQWENGELANAAACYALTDNFKVERGGMFSFSNLIAKIWPWNMLWYKPVPMNRIRELEKAAALIAAEIDRLLRKESQMEWK